MVPAAMFGTTISIFRCTNLSWPTKVYATPTSSLSHITTITATSLSHITTITATSLSHITTITATSLSHITTITATSLSHITTITATSLSHITTITATSLSHITTITATSLSHITTITATSLSHITTITATSQRLTSLSQSPSFSSCIFLFLGDLKSAEESSNLSTPPPPFTASLCRAAWARLGRWGWATLEGDTH